MQPRIYWIVASAAVILVGSNAASAAAAASTSEQKDPSSKDRSAGGTTYNTYPDDLYLDDQDAFEGSGRGGGEVRDDLEASGSGLGPDDEDGDDGHDFNNINRIESVPNKPAEPNVPYIEETHIKKQDTHGTHSVKRPDTEDDVIEPPGVNGHEDDVGDDDDDDDDGDEDVEVDNDDEDTDDTHEVLIMNPKHEDRASSFFAQPGVLAAVIGGAVVGLLCAILVVMFIVYRMRKKDEGSYALDEPRRSPAAQAYPKPGAPHHNREFYA